MTNDKQNHLSFFHHPTTTKFPPRQKQKQIKWLPPLIIILCRNDIDLKNIILCMRCNGRIWFSEKDMALLIVIRVNRTCINIFKGK